VSGGEGTGAGAGVEMGSHSSLGSHACRLPLVRGRHSVRAARSVTGTDRQAASMRHKLKMCWAAAGREAGCARCAGHRCFTC